MESCKIMPNPRNKPEIIVCESDYDRLNHLAANASEAFADVAEELLAEIDRARVVPLSDFPADAVRMESLVEFRSDAGHRRCVTLVFPGAADIAADRLSILTPIGTSLIGLSTGQSMSWTTNDGRSHELTVLRVDPPNAAKEG